MCAFSHNRPICTSSATPDSHRPAKAALEAAENEGWPTKKVLSHQPNIATPNSTKNAKDGRQPVKAGPRGRDARR